MDNASLEGQYQSFASLMEQRLAELFVLAGRQGTRFRRATAVGGFTVQVRERRRGGEEAARGSVASQRLCESKQPARCAGLEAQTLINESINPAVFGGLKLHEYFMKYANFGTNLLART